MANLPWYLGSDFAMTLLCRPWQICLTSHGSLFLQIALQIYCFFKQISTRRQIQIATEKTWCLMQNLFELIDMMLNEKFIWVDGIASAISIHITLHIPANRDSIRQHYAKKQLSIHLGTHNHCVLSFFCWPLAQYTGRY